MAKDPICGMEVPEKGANHMIHFENETFYFCSEQCKESYSLRCGIKKQSSKKGLVGRFLENLAQENKKSYGDKPPKCH